MILAADRDHVADSQGRSPDSQPESPPLIGADGSPRAEFISMLAHDLRGPLSSIAMNAGLLATGGLPDRQAKSVARISRSTDRMNRMLRDLLDYMRASAGVGFELARKAGSLADLSKQAVEEQQAANPGRKIELHAEARGQGDWDAERMTQALGNVIGNAVQYSPPDTSVSVAVSEDRGTTAIEIRNEGETIPSDVLNAAFDPYLRVRARSSVASRQGLGLGLFLTDQIVRAHGGRCELRSRSGEPTVLRITLPTGPAAAST